MYYSVIKYKDIANGTGVRTVLFVSGCTHHCRECFQPQTWDFSYGEEFTEEVADAILESLEPDYIEGLTLLGGEPFEPENQEGLLPLLRRLRQRWPIGSAKNVWCYTGYTLETDILADGGKARCAATEELLSYIDVLVDGEFIIEQKDISLRFRGSKNQRLIALPATLREGKTVLWDS